MQTNFEITPMEIPPPRQSYAEIFARMEIGDGFKVCERDIASVRASASGYKKKFPDWSYTSRKSDSGGYNLIRIEKN